MEMLFIKLFVSESVMIPSTIQNTEDQDTRNNSANNFE
jgi:hypothetical protein